MSGFLWVLHVQLTAFDERLTSFVKLDREDAIKMQNPYVRDSTLNPLRTLETFR